MHAQMCHVCPLHHISPQQLPPIDLNREEKVRMATNGHPNSSPYQVTNQDSIGGVETTHGTIGRTR